MVSNETTPKAAETDEDTAGEVTFDGGDKGKGKVAPDSNKSGHTIIVWVPIIISVLALLVSIGSGYATWRQASEAARQTAQTAQVNADNVIQRFADQGLALGKTPSCFRYALSLTDDELRAAFSEKMQNITVRRAYLDELQTCLGVDSEITVLKKANLDTFRMKIQQKLNSYEMAFESMRNGIRKKESICKTVFQSFQQSAAEFLKKMKNMSNKADEFKSDDDWSTALEIAKNGTCQ